MSKISQNSIDKVKAAVDIVDVISSFVRLEKKDRGMSEYVRFITIVIRPCALLHPVRYTNVLYAEQEGMCLIS